MHELMQACKRVHNHYHTHLRPVLLLARELLGLLGLRTAAHPSASRNTACCWCADCWPFEGEAGGRDRDSADEALVSREPGKIKVRKN